MPPLADRRTFLTTLTAGFFAAPLLRLPRRSARDPARRLGARSPARYPIAFSTLGCPSWTWKTILNQADRLGYAAIELRGVAGEMDLTKVPELSGSQLPAAKKALDALGLVVSDLGASAAMHETGEARVKALDEGRRFIDLAHAMGVKHVRVFGDRLPPGESRDAVLARVVEGFQQLCSHAAPAGVTVLMESHGDFTHSSDIEWIRAHVGSDAFAILWDAHHTFVAGREQPADTWRVLAPWIRHTHLKDSKAAGSDRRYVLTGEGDVPVKTQVEVLARAGYKGYYCFEWEKKWHPEIEEPEIAFPHYARVMTGYLKESGVQPR